MPVPVVPVTEYVEAATPAAKRAAAKVFMMTRVVENIIFLFIRQ